MMMGLGGSTSQVDHMRLCFKLYQDRSCARVSQSQPRGCGNFYLIAINLSRLVFAFRVAIFLFARGMLATGEANV
jgi:hypothetical protein